MVSPENLSKKLKIVKFPMRTFILLKLVMIEVQISLLCNFRCREFSNDIT